MKASFSVSSPTPNRQPAPDRRRRKILVQSLGCPKNLVDSESMSLLIREAGYALVSDFEEADAIVINTCAFIESAKNEAIDAILDAAAYKANGRCRAVLVCGCLAERYAKEILSDLPEADAVLGVCHYQDIVPVLDELLLKDGREPGAQGRTQTVVPEEGAQSVPRTRAICLCAPSKEGRLAHLRADREPSSKGFAYLKIAEGCSHRCAFCAIPSIRGTLLSRPMEDILSEAAALLSKGYRELILVAQDSTAYGLDLYHERRFTELMRRLSSLDFHWIRFLYGYANGIHDELLQLIQARPNLLPYFDIPIQHASNAVLRRMRRPDTKESLRACFAAIRRSLPNACLRSTVIVGFPGETEADFQELLDFVREIRFDRLGCFIFSPEEGTAAYSFEERVDPATARARMERLMAVQEAISLEKMQARVGEEIEGLIEGISEDGVFYRARSADQAPEIDPETYVLVQSRSGVPPELKIGEIYPLRLVEASAFEYTAIYGG